MKYPIPSSIVDSQPRRKLVSPYFDDEHIFAVFVVALISVGAISVWIRMFNKSTPGCEIVNTATNFFL
jgi:hypothetical protein